MSAPLVANRISVYGCDCGSVHIQLHGPNHEVIATASLDADTVVYFAASCNAASLKAISSRRAAEMSGEPGCTRH